MDYVKNEQGEVKIRSKKGQFKWVQEKLAEDKQLMKTMGFEVVEAPLKPSFIISEYKDCDAKPNEDEKVIIVNEEETNVAEATPAKRGPKPKK